MLKGTLYLALFLPNRRKTQSNRRPRLQVVCRQAGVDFPLTGTVTVQVRAKLRVPRYSPSRDRISIVQMVALDVSYHSSLSCQDQGMR
jgi:hypothetical protein